MRADPAAANEFRVLHRHENIFLNIVNDTQDLVQIAPMHDDAQLLDRAVRALAHNFGDAVTPLPVMPAYAICINSSRISPPTPRQRHLPYQN